MPPRLDLATFVKFSFVFNAVAAESIQNGPFSGAATEKDVASEARNAPVPGGPGTSNTLCFQMFLENNIHPGSASRKISKSWVGPTVRKWPLAGKKEHISGNGFFYDFANRVGRQHKSILGLLVRTISYFVLLTKRHDSSKLAPK